MTRVQIPAYTDRWMKGDRFGEIVRTSREQIRNVRAELLTRAAAAAYRAGARPAGAGLDDGVEFAHVRLDKSGRTVRVILADCEVVK
jgi:hypothetical protein